MSNVSGHLPFSELYESTWSLVVDAARRRICDRETACDLAQEAFLRLHTSWDGLPAHARVPWLHRVLRNLCTDHLRRRRKGPRAIADTPLRDSEALPAGPRHLPDAIAIEGESLAALQRHVDELPCYMRTALVHRIEGTSSQTAAARAAGCAVKTISTRVHRARRRLALRDLRYRRYLRCG